MNEMYKKRGLKFSYEKVSRDLRHAESLKARETSRFERLSMIRSINDSDLNEKSMEKSDEYQSKGPENKKPSRLEMLFKWKQEKQIKKEMEKLSKKKPFYAGRSAKAVDNKNSEIFKLPIVHPNSTFNSSKIIKSRHETPAATVLASRIQNSKQGVLGLAVHSSRVPNSKQDASTTTFQASRIPNTKQTSSLQKSANNLIRSNSTTVTSTSRKLPTSASIVDKTSSLQKPGSSSFPRKFPGPAATISKAAPVSKVGTGIQRAHSAANKTPNNALISKSKVLPKPVNKGSFESKSSSKCQEGKPVMKTGTGLLKSTSNATAVSKGIPIQRKMPISNMNTKFGSTPKLNQKETLKENVPSRKGYCFKTAIATSSRQKNENLKKTSLQGTPKKLQERTTKEEKSSKREFSEQSHDCLPDVTFNSDISIIKPSRTSFAPMNFTFQPPEGLGNFVFEEEEENIHEILEEVKLKFMSRTSTPSKDSERKSSIKNAEESLEPDSLMADVKQMSNTSKSKDICISELMTPDSFKVRSENKETNKALNIQACIEDIAVKHVDNFCQELFPLKPGIKEVNVAENQQDFKQLASVFLIENDIKGAGHIMKEKNFEEKIKNDLVKKSFSEEQTVCNFVESENVEENAVDVCKKSLFNNSIIIQQNFENISHNKYLTKTDSIEEKVENDLVKKSFSEEQTVCNFVKSENVEENAVDVCKKSLFNNSIIIEQNFEDISHNKYLTKTESVEEKVENDLVKKSSNEEQTVCNFVKSETVKENAVEISKKSLFNNCLKNGTSPNEKSLFPDYDDEDSLLDSIDLNKIQLIKSDEEDSDEVPSPEILKQLKRRTNGAVPKRVSMLKNVLVMNSIVEATETDKCSVSPIKTSMNNKETKITPRRSKRISGHANVDMLNDSPIKNHADCQNTPVTPRRSLRFMKMPTDSDNVGLSPFEEKKTSNVNLRRSRRLIDLNTPEKAVCEKLYGENMDPNKFLIDLESPPMSSLPKSKKVSLLYSPEKRKSIRRSIKGDLMAFSPS